MLDDNNRGVVPHREWISRDKVESESATVQ
jgi:hypothetical protein